MEVSQSVNALSVLSSGLSRRLIKSTGAGSLCLSHAAFSKTKVALMCSVILLNCAIALTVTWLLEIRMCMQQMTNQISPLHLTYCA